MNGMVDILGSEWEIDLISRENDKHLKEMDGYCDKTVKRIVIAEDTESFFEKYEECVKVAIRHEIIHAFMIESGLDNNWEHANQFGQDETTIDWFAIQFPKILKVYKELGLVDE